jgi:hypothetical protein
LLLLLAHIDIFYCIYASRWVHRSIALLPCRLDNNQIGDEGAKAIAAAVAGSGVKPVLGPDFSGSGIGLTKLR